MFLLLFLIPTLNAVNAEQGHTTFAGCSDNEEWRECGKQCENQCQSLCELYTCLDLCLPSACACKNGFYRDPSSGTCIEHSICPSCPKTINYPIPISQTSPVCDLSCETGYYCDITLNGQVCVSSYKQCGRHEYYNLCGNPCEVKCESAFTSVIDSVSLTKRKFIFPSALLIVGLLPVPVSKTITETTMENESPRTNVKKKSAQQFIVHPVR